MLCLDLLQGVILFTLCSYHDPIQENNELKFVIRYKIVIMCTPYNLCMRC